MRHKSGLVGGIILILLGLLFLAGEIFPGLRSFWEWPFMIVLVGLVFLFWAAIGGVGGLAIPGSILTGIGGILYYQNAYNAWETWSFAWALIPGFVGIGIWLSGLIDRNFKSSFFSGLSLMVISAILFFAFGSFFGMTPEVTKYWPVLLVILGVISLIKAFVRKPKTEV
ncbi:MAG: hypothetical protein H0S79_11125 [Anaerolineaceae bacterium]|jgi:hypothetical protein|nr:hypothetical protein [Anaerolineaceae bacterium]